MQGEDLGVEENEYHCHFLRAGIFCSVYFLGVSVGNNYNCVYHKQLDLILKGEIFINFRFFFRLRQIPINYSSVSKNYVFTYSLKTILISLTLSNSLSFPRPLFFPETLPNNFQ